jgi:hypothetical protein
MLSTTVSSNDAAALIGFGRLEPVGLGLGVVAWWAGAGDTGDDMLFESEVLSVAGPLAGPVGLMGLAGLLTLAPVEVMKSLLGADDAVGDRRPPCAGLDGFAGLPLEPPGLEGLGGGATGDLSPASPAL